VTNVAFQGEKYVIFLCPMHENVHLRRKKIAEQFTDLTASGRIYISNFGDRLSKVWRHWSFLFSQHQPEDVTFYLMNLKQMYKSLPFISKTETMDAFCWGQPIWLWSRSSGLDNRLLYL